MAVLCVSGDSPLGLPFLGKTEFDTSFSATFEASSFASSVPLGQDRTATLPAADSSAPSDSDLDVAGRALSEPDLSDVPALPAIDSPALSSLKVDSIVPPVLVPPELAASAGNALGPQSRAGGDDSYWRYSTAGMNPGECKIVGWDNNHRPLNSVAVVPATATVGGVSGLKVVEMSKDSDAAFAGMNCQLTFAPSSNLRTISDRCFMYDIESPAGVSGALNLPNSLESIGESTFRGNPLTSLTLPENSNFILIPRWAFLNCKNLTGTLKIPDNVQTIRDSAFENDKLKKLSFGSNSQLTMFGTKCFRGNKIGADEFAPGDTRNGVIEFPANASQFYTNCFENNQIINPIFDRNGSISLNAAAFRNNRIDVDPLSNQGPGANNTFSALGDNVFAYNNISHMDFSRVTSPLPGINILANNPELLTCVISPYWSYLPGGLFSGNTKLYQVGLLVDSTTGRSSLKRIARIPSAAARALRPLI